MQLFKVEQILQMLITANDLYNKLLGTLFKTASQEIITNFGNVFSSLAQGDWKTFVVSGFILVGLIIFIYRLARKKPFVAISSIFDK